MPPPFSPSQDLVAIALDTCPTGGLLKARARKASRPDQFFRLVKPTEAATEAVVALIDEVPSSEGQIGCA